MSRKPVNEEWRRQANCRGKDTALFFPGRGDYWGIRNAKAICAECIVKRECLSYSMTQEHDGTTGEDYGVWGGLSQKERQKVRPPRRSLAS